MANFSNCFHRECVLLLLFFAQILKFFPKSWAMVQTQRDNVVFQLWCWKKVLMGLKLHFGRTDFKIDQYFSGLSRFFVRPWIGANFCPKSTYGVIVYVSLRKSQWGRDKNKITKINKRKSWKKTWDCHGVVLAESEQL